jgi:hypothetical protein
MENKAVEGSSALLQGSFYHPLPREGIVSSAACCPLAAHLGQGSPPRGIGETQEEEGMAKGMACTAGFGKSAPIAEGLEQAIAAGVQKRSEEEREESLTPGSGSNMKASSGDQQRPCVYVHDPLLGMEGGEEKVSASAAPVEEKEGGGGSMLQQQQQEQQPGQKQSQSQSQNQQQRQHRDGMREIRAMVIAALPCPPMPIMVCRELAGECRWVQRSRSRHLF